MFKILSEKSNNLLEFIAQFAGIERVKKTLSNFQRQYYYGFPEKMSLISSVARFAQMEGLLERNSKMEIIATPLLAPYLQMIKAIRPFITTGDFYKIRNNKLLRAIMLTCKPRTDEQVYLENFAKELDKPDEYIRRQARYFKCLGYIEERDDGFYLSEDGAKLAAIWQKYDKVYREYAETRDTAFDLLKNNNNLMLPASVLSQIYSKGAELNKAQKTVRDFCLLCGLFKIQRKQADRRSKNYVMTAKGEALRDYIAAHDLKEGELTELAPIITKNTYELMFAIGDYQQKFKRAARPYQLSAKFSQSAVKCKHLAEYDLMEIAESYGRLNSRHTWRLTEFGVKIVNFCQYLLKHIYIRG